MKNDIRQDLVDLYDDPDLLFADGFDNAILGVTIGFNGHVVVYDIKKIISHLMEDGMTHEEAEEYFDFNIAGAYVGGRTPIYINVYEK